MLLKYLYLRRCEQPTQHKAKKIVGIKKKTIVPTLQKIILVWFSFWKISRTINDISIYYFGNILFKITLIKRIQDLSAR
jgi:hypothetical protein